MKAGGTIAPHRRDGDWPRVKSLLEGGAARPWEGEDPRELPLEDISEFPEVFQQRGAERYRSEAHVKELARQISASGGALDPVTVVWSAEGWVLIDGHHRMEAYRQAKWKRPIPVKVFKGTPEEALAESLCANNRAKLQMTQDERMNAAWWFVCRTGLARSIPECAKVCGVTERTISNMREVRKRLEKQGVKDMVNMTWKEARRGEREPREFDEDKAIAEFVAKLRRAFPGGRFTRDPELTVKVLAAYDPSKRDYFLGPESEEGEDY